MEWRYKTTHYAVKKEGLLGGSFLDEEEMEASLNDYGEKGWELVSLLEVRDGVIAVFKQEKNLFQGGHLAEIVPEQDEDSLCDVSETDAESHLLQKATSLNKDDCCMSEPCMQPKDEDADVDTEESFATIRIE